ncbi:MAG TPA: hypothetical protein VMA98_11445 [Candidatus Acidoferrales bacterium]|nr:hypothetical protein [Candidatus Acidoferrales bacterium]
MRTKILAALTALALLSPVAAAAQDVPSYAQPAQMAAPADEQIRGRIASFDGAYSLTVNDDRGFVDNVQLHDGTIINPTGLTLAPGMVVSILGYNAGSFFAANEVDTPYTYVGAVPYYGGHPWYYWGPTISLGFFFGNPGWWHGGYFRGGYHYVGGARVYVGAPVRGVYRYGAWNGRAYVAPRARGGYYPHAAAHPPGHPHIRF